MRYLFPVLFLACCSSSASAALIPYYRMDSLAFLASDVVLCEEVEHNADQGVFKVIEVFKGDCKPKQELTIELDRSYSRNLVPRIAQKDGHEKLPLGRALLFLKRDKAKGKAGEEWRPVTGGVKPVVNGEAYCYGQFHGNPGLLYLARMGPENIEVPETTPYDEKLLIKDLKSALEKAKGLKEADPTTALHASVRKDPKVR